ncbi:MAG: serine hydrolase domain-containing protein [Actinomycetota bacterium]
MSAVPEPEELAELLADVAAPIMTKQRVPGVSIGVSSATTAASRHLGVTNIDHPLDPTDRAVYQIGSISKIFTATVAMQMVAEGLFDLDTPIRRWLPDLRLGDEAVAAAVTVRHLLQHTGGWYGDFAADTGRGDDALASMAGRLASTVQATALGSTFHYSNLGYVLLGQVIEATGERSFERSVRERIIEPASLADTALFPEDVIFGRIAAGHVVGSETVRLSGYGRPRARVANGGVLSSLADVLHFGRIHLRDGVADDGTRLLSAVATRSMREPGPPTGVDDEHRGFGWCVSDRYGVSLVEHSGATPGFQTMFAVLPEHDRVMAVLTNANIGGVVAREVMRRLREVLAGVDELPAATGAIDADGFDEITGVYLGNGVLQIAGTARAPVLVTWMGAVRDPRRHPIAAAGVSGRFEVTDGPLRGNQFDLVRDESGAIGHLRYNGSRLFRPVRDDRDVDVLERLVERHPEFANELTELRDRRSSSEEGR